MNIEINGILQNILTTIREDGWSPNGWNLTPPYCLKAAMTQAIWQAYPVGMARQEAFTKTLAVLSQTIHGKPTLGMIGYWEQDEKRTQTDVEAVLIETIETLKGVAA